MSGNGGFVEVSGRDFLDYLGSVNTLAPNGVNGALLLDPTDMAITTTADCQYYRWSRNMLLTHFAPSGIQQFGKYAHLGND